jgi:RES domain
MAHPDPPASFNVLIRKVRGTWLRIHSSRHGAIFFGRKLTPGDNRFDAPAGEFGVLYVGRDAHCAFVETFLHKTGVRLVTTTELSQRTLSVVEARRPLRLVDLCGEGLARMGADASLTSATDYALTQRWSKALHEHPRKPDGILYRARHDPSRFAAAVFERVQPELTTHVVGTLSDPVRTNLLADILDTYDVGLV